MEFLIFFIKFMRLQQLLSFFICEKKVSESAGHWRACKSRVGASYLCRREPLQLQLKAAKESSTFFFLSWKKDEVEKVKKKRWKSKGSALFCPPSSSSAERNFDLWLFLLLISPSYPSSLFFLFSTSLFFFSCNSLTVTSCRSLPPASQPPRLSWAGVELEWSSSCLPCCWFGHGEMSTTKAHRCACTHSQDSRMNNFQSLKHLPEQL